jgi:alkylhydroperoxidase/carboxymuconolactone decarboxylase family protein YurZ
LPKITLSEGALPDKIKFLIHSAITASQHDVESKTVHITGPIRAGTGERELFETAATIIKVYGLSSFGVFLDAWKRWRKNRPS